MKKTNLISTIWQPNPYEWAIQLASLLWQYLSPKKYRELIRWDYILISEIEKAIASGKEEIFLEFSGQKRAYKKSELKDILEKTKKGVLEKRKAFESFCLTWNFDDLNNILPKKDNKKIVSWKDLLWGNNNQNEIDKIIKLYNIPEIRDLYKNELIERRDKFDLLYEWNKRLSEVVSCDNLIEKWKEEIISIKAKAWRDHRKTTPDDNFNIKEINLWIKEEILKKSELLKERPIATVYRNYILRKYKTQLNDFWFVITKSRQEIIDKIIEQIFAWNNILLVWPTGTWKTALWIKAIQLISKMIWKQDNVSEISGQNLLHEMNSVEKQKNILDTIDNFVYVLSGHAGITPSEFIAKTKLRSDWKWWTETYTELWKVLKAFVEWSIPLIDEMDLIPNEILMRIKHLFSLRTNEIYSPQEDGNKKYKLLSNVVIWTANIKSKKHPWREDIDPAILRLFKWINVSYLPKEELYDLAIVSLMEEEWYMYGVDKSCLDTENSFLCLLLEAIKDIEENYIGNWDGEKISTWEKSFLKKTLLETWRFIKLFTWYHSSWLKFKEFIKNNLIDIVCDFSLPKQDRLIIMKILGAKNIISKSDILNILNSSFDYTEKELEENIISQGDDDKEWLEFLDVYDIANLDPYFQRNLDELSDSEDKKLLSFIQYLSQYLLNMEDNSFYKNLEELSDKLLEQYELNWNFNVSDSDKKEFASWVYWLVLEDSDIQSYIDPISYLLQEWSK